MRYFNVCRGFVNGARLKIVLSKNSNYPKETYKVSVVRILEKTASMQESGGHHNA